MVYVFNVFQDQWALHFNILAIWLIDYWIKKINDNEGIPAVSTCYQQSCPR